LNDKLITFWKQGTPDRDGLNPVTRREST